MENEQKLLARKEKFRKQQRDLNRSRIKEVTEDTVIAELAAQGRRDFRFDQIFHPDMTQAGLYSNVGKL